jgi:hypothetical protein
MITDCFLYKVLAKHSGLKQIYNKKYLANDIKRNLKIRVTVQMYKKKKPPGLGSGFSKK